MTNEPRLTRRKLLASVGVAGTGLAFSGASTYALLSDEERSENNSIRAGTLDLELDWVKYYHGRTTRTEVQEATSNPGPIFELSDVKPGDCGGGVVSIHPRGNPAYVYTDLQITANAENGHEEPEEGARHEDDIDVGELGKHIRVVAKPNMYLLKGDSLEGEKSQFIRESCPDREDFDESDCYFLGTLAGMADATDGGFLLDGGYDPLNSPNETYPLGAGSTFLVNFVWWLPESVGNAVQGDSVTFDLKFAAVQARHLENPESHEPFTAD